MTIELRPMPAVRLGSWIDEVRRDYEQSRRASGESVDIAAEKARVATAESFPDGVPAEGNIIYDVVWLGADSHIEVVGHLWISRLKEGTGAWWVSDIKINEPHRGAGYGRTVMQLAEKAAAEQGATTLGLNVFGYNVVARGLYESLGYETTAVQMRKSVSR